MGMFKYILYRVLFPASDYHPILIVKRMKKSKELKNFPFIVVAVIGYYQRLVFLLFWETLQLSFLAVLVLYAVTISILGVRIVASNDLEWLEMSPCILALKPANKIPNSNMVSELLVLQVEIYELHSSTVQTMIFGQ
ncbi:unnamed protein product [Prunus armeniaca]